MLVSALKDIVASAIGVPVGQQRLIFRGRVLKDDHHLSDYRILVNLRVIHFVMNFDIFWVLCLISYLLCSLKILVEVENGHTLHLVERQPVQPQTPGGPSTGNANENSNNNGVYFVILLFLVVSKLIFLF